MFGIKIAVAFPKMYTVNFLNLFLNPRSFQNEINFAYLYYIRILILYPRFYVDCAHIRPENHRGGHTIRPYYIMFINRQV